MPSKDMLCAKDSHGQRKSVLSGKQSLGSASFDLPQPPPVTKAKEWSPIDRMLANKRSSKSPKFRRQASDNDLPPLHRESPVHSACSQVQTTSWNALLAEALAPERQRCSALQGEIKALRALIKEKERERELEGDTHIQNLEQKWAEERAKLKAEIENLHREKDAVLAKSEADESRSHDLELEWKKKVGAATDSVRQGREDANALREELFKSQSDVKGLQKQIAALRAENATVAQERDRALQQLEQEQSEMMARVDAMEQRMMQRAK